MNPLELLKNPNFIKWFGNSSVKDTTGNPLRVFHGTRKPDFDSFNTNNFDNTMIDRSLGTHFAKDPRLTDSFTVGEYARDTKNWFNKGKPQFISVGDDVIGEGGRVIPGYLNIKARTIPQKKYSNGSVETDQYAIGVDVARVVFPKRKDLFIENYKRYGGDATEAAKIYDDIINKKSKYKDFGEFARDKGPPNISFGSNDDVQRQLVDSYRGELKSGGYTGIKYTNTSPNEVKQGVDPTSYIAFEPTSFKSQFNRGTYNANDPNILKGLVGAGVVGAILAPQQAQAENWRNYQNKEPALQEPIIDPTTLLAGPARWGGGLMNLVANTGLNAIMGKLR